MGSPLDTSLGGGGRAFPSTRWSRILSSRGDGQARRAALGELLDAYWKPRYFFARRKGREEKSLC